jgi:hypothetical protein
MRSKDGASSESVVPGQRPRRSSVCALVWGEGGGGGGGDPDHTATVAATSSDVNAECVDGWNLLLLGASEGPSAADDGGRSAANASRRRFRSLPRSAAGQAVGRQILGKAHGSDVEVLLVVLPPLSAGCGATGWP